MQKLCNHSLLTGIQPWEEKYPEMAKAMGIDPSVSRFEGRLTVSDLLIILCAFTADQEVCSSGTSQ